MKIKYLKDTPTANKDDVVEIDTVYGVALVAMGYAEEIEDQPTAKTTKTTKKTTAK